MLWTGFNVNHWIIRSLCRNRTLRLMKLLQGVLLIIQAAEFRSFRETETRGLGSVIDVGGSEDCQFWGQLRSVVLQFSYRKL